MFVLHPNLQKKIFLLDLPLCRILLEDNRHYPWVFLIPRRPDVSRMIDLSPEDEKQLFQELQDVQRVMWTQFRPIQLNVAAIGNKTTQLHIHVIARYEQDPAWPHTVWDHVSSKESCAYAEETKIETVRRLQSRIEEAYFEKSR